MLDQNLKSARFKRSLLAMSIMALGAPAVSTATAAESVEEITIVGLRSSIVSAQEIKRNSNTVEDVVTASDIGALPDKSVTEALQRVPGVTISRFASGGDPNHFAAEGRGVLVRGLDRVRSEFNGRDSFSANSDTGLNYEDIPPELLGSVHVIKNQTADLISGGISGTVNLVTRKPFDSTERLTSFSVKESYGDLIGKTSPSYSGLFSDRWETSAGEFGALVAVSASKFDARGDGVNIENFYNRSKTQTEFPSMGSTALAALPDGNVNVPFGAQIRTSDSDRDRKGFDVSLQWKNSDETLLATAEFINGRSVENWRERVVSSAEQGFNAPFTSVQLADIDPVTAGTQTDAHFDNRGFFTDGTLTHLNGYVAASRIAHVDNKIKDGSFHLAFTPDDKLKIDLDVQHATSTAAVVNNTISNRFSNANQYIDLRGETPKVKFTQDTKTLDPDPTQRGKYYQTSIMDTNINADGSLSSFKLDGAYQVDNGWFKAVSTGVYASNKERTVKDDDYSNWGSVSATWLGDQFSSGLAAPGNERIYEPFTFGKDYFDGNVLQGSNTTFLFPRISDAKNIVAYDAYLIAHGISNTGRVNRMDRFSSDGVHADSLGYLPSEINRLKEDRREAYVRFDFANDELAMPVKANLGLRYVNYKVESAGANKFKEIIPTTNTSVYPLYQATYPEYAVFFNKSESIVQAVKPDSFHDLLPSLNVSVSLKDDLVLRFAASKALYYPDMRSLRNSGTYLGTVTKDWKYDDLEHETWGCEWGTVPLRCNSVVGVSHAGIAGFRGNPELKPEQANQFDLSLEWYFSKSNSLTATIFDKSLHDLFREKNFMETVTNPSNGTTQEMLVRKPVNEGSGTIKGFEVAYTQFYDFLPGAWSGLGLQLNYTYVDQQDLNDKRGDLGSPNNISNSPNGDNRNTFRNFTGLGLLNLSKDTYNATLMYEHSDISARLAYNWRSGYLLARRDSDSFSAIYADATASLDASVWYTINQHFKVGLEGSNLLGEVTSTQTQFNQEGTKTPKSFFNTDKRYSLSLRGTF